MRPGNFSISVCSRTRISHFSATMSGAQPMAAKLHGAVARRCRAWRRQGMVHHRYRPAALGHGFQYQFWTGFFACDSGEFNSLHRWWSHLADSDQSSELCRYRSARRGHRTAICLLAEEGARFSAFARPMHRTGRSRRFSTKPLTVNLGGDLIQGGINGIGLCGQTFVAVDRSGTATNNNVYMLASVIPFGASNGTDVMFARSTDGGANL